ncbi:protein disabled isoform X3 [Nymphalis io]|uniref:protein disabled isoform X3 n=1 Tax=Inachis io TaxID=171585 RepID=UPI002166F005|nr:protein disabled isoform X3 [Nymphalis io]
MFNHKLPTDFPMQTLRKKTSPCKYKNEPGRFLGEGVSFRAKLIGVLEVPEARGDRMCQEALADLKMAIRAAGEHKQRIQVHVAIDGLRLRDDKTGDSLYHHPVHKISFIAQDMTDSRAFGYIFGSPDTGHRFFGIKTDKAASQVVIAMRDLFQVVFELKKKEVEMAKQQLEGKNVTSSLIRHTTSTVTDTKTKIIPMTGEPSSSISKPEGGGEGGVAELVDLEQELCSLRRGLTQVEGLTPSTDPFGDSFIIPAQQKGLLPPPPGAPRGRAPPRSLSPGKPVSFDLSSVAGDYEPKPATLVDEPDPPVHSQAASASASAYDVFTELDPLGTGRSKPYVDKKLFFQELKNPPKKVLKDLVPPAHSLLSDILPGPSETRAEAYGPPTALSSLSRHSGGTVAIAKPTRPTFSSDFFTSDPFAETDPFDNTDPFRDDPFTSVQDFPKLSSLRTEEPKGDFSKELIQDKPEPDAARNVFNGPLQVSLPPEPAPKSPRLPRQNTNTSTIRQRPHASSKLNAESASPPPPLPPKKIAELSLIPPPRPPHDHEDMEESETPPLPKPARKKEPLADRSTKPRQSSLATTSSEDEYLTPVPPPLPAAKRFDITLSQLLTLTMDDLAARLRVPATTLSSMTLPQLTEYLRSYVATENEKSHVHLDPTKRPEKEKITPIIPEISAPSKVPEKPVTKAPLTTDFKPQFEDNFAPTETSDGFVANFDDFDQKANPSYDKYAAFREIQEQELKAKSILDPIASEIKQEDDKEVTSIVDLIKTEEPKVEESKELDKSPLKSLDELTIDSFNMFRNSVSPKPIDAKIEDIKTVMKNLQIEKARRSVSPRDNGVPETKSDENNDRYAALREITIIEPPDEFESIPPEAPKERKKSDEKSDGFDNSDFFDCIDNSSLSFNVEDAFRKSPGVKDKEEEKKVEEKKETPIEVMPVRDLQPPTRLSAGSISDVNSGSSPDTKERCLPPVMSVGGLTRLGWGEGWSSDSRDSEPRTRRRRTHNRGLSVQTSSSSRDASPWDDEPPRRPARRERPERHNSSGSRECLDSGSGREKEKPRDKRGSRDIDLNREGRESARDRRDSGSGRDRRDVSKEREHRDHRERGRRDRRSREREKDTWSRERNYSRERDYRDSRSRERSKDYRDMDRHRKPIHSYDDEDYSDGGSGRSSPRERWPDQRWRRDERNYGSLGWRETRRRNELRQNEDPNERRYGSTLGWPGRRSTTIASRREVEREMRDARESARDSRDTRDSGRDSGRDSRDPRDSGRDSRDARDSGRDSGRDSRDPRDSGRESGRDSRDARDSVRDSRDPRRRRREEPRTRPRDYRFSNDFSPREREHTSPFDNDFQDTPTPTTKKRAPYSCLEGTRFAFELEDSTASPLSGSSARARDGDSPATRFRFDSDSLSPRSMFEDDFTTISTPRGRTASIAEEDEGDLPPLRAKPQQHRDIKKSDSVNIFTRESDPFEGDAFFACTGSDRVARRENWPGDFQGFDNA